MSIAAAVSKEEKKAKIRAPMEKQQRQIVKRQRLEVEKSKRNTP
jgi:hypothetical protein